MGRGYNLSLSPNLLLLSDTEREGGTRGALIYLSSSYNMRFTIRRYDKGKIEGAGQASKNITEDK